MKYTSIFGNQSRAYVVEQYSLGLKAFKKMFINPV